MSVMKYKDPTTGEIKKVGAPKADTYAPFKPAGKSYLKFSSPNSFTLAVGDATKHWDGTLEYFASNKTWTTWDGTTTLSSANNDGEHVLYLRGTGNTVLGYHNVAADTYVPLVINGTDVRCNGNIETLLDYATVEAGEHPTMVAECFSGLFMGCTALTVAPALPATTLAVGCYMNMFNGCTNLAQAPDLPATTLTDYCYYRMFEGCTGLTQAPALPATRLAESCYMNMFNGCTNLAHAPVLPATVLANNCYYNMFRGCTSLTRVPALPATTLAVGCYRSMFRDCTSLTRVPALPVTTLEADCYHSMFRGCTSLTRVPALPATVLANNCYDGMFQNCTGLKLSTTQTGEYKAAYRIPTTETGTTATNALIDMFTSTGGTFTGTPEINTTYYLSSDNMIVRETEIATLNGYVGSIAAPASHASDTTIHVTAEEKAGWNAKLDSFTETDPTVPAWAKAASKPSYTASEVGAIPTSEKGAASGVATLGTDGKVPTGQLPAMDYAPSIHASQHASGGSDPITPADIGAATMDEVNSAIQTAIGNAIGGSY